MNAEDKKLIADYMGWKEHKSYIVDSRVSIRFFDLNDARLCVEKMVEKGDWEECFDVMETKWLLHGREHQDENYSQFTSWLFNADNFFSAMAAWLKEK